MKKYFLVAFLFAGAVSSAQTICLTDLELEVFHLLNEKRAEAGLNEVVFSEPLMFLANKNQKEIIDQSYMVYKPGEIKGTEYSGKIGTIRTTTSNTTADRIVGSFLFQSQYTKHYEVLFNKGDFSNSNWKSVGICIRPAPDNFTSVYLIFGDVISAPITNPVTCNEPVFFDTKVKTDPILKIYAYEEVPGANTNFVFYIRNTNQAGVRTLDKSCPYYTKVNEPFMIYLRDQTVKNYEVTVYPELGEIVPQKATTFFIMEFNQDTIFKTVVLYGNSVKEVEAALIGGYGLDQTEPNDPFGFTMLHRAVRRDNFEVVKLLLAKGATLNFFSKGNELPIAFCQSDAIFNLMLGYKPKLDYVTKTGGNLLHSLSSNGCLAGVKYLVETLKFDVNAIDQNQNQTAINAAVYENHLDVAIYLLKHEANPNIKSWGYYPIQSAVRNKNLEMVKLLISYKANANVLDENKKSPYFYATVDAKNTKNYDIVNYFESIGINQ